MPAPHPHQSPLTDRSGGFGLMAAAWRAALTALRANLIPGLLLQALMAGMALAYLFHQPSRAAFEDLAILRSRWGLLFSFIGTSLASSIFPEVLRLLLPKSYQKSPQGIAARLLFGIPFWGLIGIQVDSVPRLHLLEPHKQRL